MAESKFPGFTDTQQYEAFHKYLHIKVAKMEINGKGALHTKM